MGSFGLFTRTEAREKAAAAPKALALPVERLHQLGTAGVRNMNPKARCPEMAPSGPRRPLVYILGEAPGEEEDKQGEPFVGPAGRLLRKAIPKGLAGETRFNNCVRTLPPIRNGSRTPLPLEVECFRPSVVEDITTIRPAVVMGTGNIPLSWMLGNVGTIKVCRGRRFPVALGGHSFWFYPVLHPSYILRVENQDGREDQIPGEEWRRSFDRDVAQVYRDAQAGLPTPEVEPTDEENLFRGVETYTGGDPEPVLRFIRKMNRESRVAVDIEANCLRPYRAGAKLLAIGLGTYRHAMSFAVNHPGTRWKATDLKRILEELKALLLSPVRKVAHNLKTELEWFAWLYGEEVLAAADTWDDTMEMAYSLDERNGGHSLHFLSTLYFGLKLKNVSKSTVQTGLFSEDEKIDRARLERANVVDVLRYNALDAKYEDKLCGVEQERLETEELAKFYQRHQVSRIAAIVQAQRAGLVVNAEEVERWDRTTSGQIKKALRDIAQSDEVARYNKRFGKFSPTSNVDLVRMFKDVLKRKEGIRGKSYTTDEEALKAMADCPLAGMILALRKPAKLRSTYVEPLRPDSASSVVYPDGRLHPQYNTTFTGTGRLSCEDPNAQNFPKRRNKEVRSMVGVPPGHVMVCVDYGQLEYRLIGMDSQDKTIIDSLWNDYDVHMAWAEAIVRKYPETCRRRYGSLDEKALKAFRGDVKNQMVFPSFYGAGIPSISNNLEMPENILSRIFDRFWVEFAGVKTWQKALRKFYEKWFYVRTLTGRRRRGPLSHNMIINSPIQGAASDLVVDAMRRLARLALEQDTPYLAPVLNIHDDLSFYLPRKKVDTALEVIVPAMVHVPFRWAKVVPVAVEVSVGPNWYAQEEIGKFRSDKVPVA